jgi:hypothetical protein
LDFRTTSHLDGPIGLPRNGFFRSLGLWVRIVGLAVGTTHVGHRSCRIRGGLTWGLVDQPPCYRSRTLGELGLFDTSGTCVDPVIADVFGSLVGRVMDTIGEHPEMGAR